MRYLLGLVGKSAPVQPARDVDAYALEEQLDDVPAHTAPQPPHTTAASVAPAPVARAAAEDDMPHVARDERANARAVDDGRDARDADHMPLIARDIDRDVVAEPARPRSGVPSDAEPMRPGPPRRGGEPAPERTHERLVLERTLERTTHVERVERATTVLRPVASVAAAAPVVSATARRAVPSAPAAAPPAAAAPRVPDVTIAIGTIELRGAGAPAPPPPRAQRPRLSLDEYLASRNGAR
jgi:hypothetical protein